MKNIELIENFDFDRFPENGKNLQVREIYNGERRRLISILLRNGGVLPKHKANEPITVLCLAGEGTFRAGADLEDAERLKAGTLITLETGVEHEAVAEPELHLLVSRFKSD